jgi:hypothetical protein
MRASTGTACCPGMAAQRTRHGAASSSAPPRAIPSTSKVLASAQGSCGPSAGQTAGSPVIFPGLDERRRAIEIQEERFGEPLLQP